ADSKGSSPLRDLAGKSHGGELPREIFRAGLTGRASPSSFSSAGAHLPSTAPFPARSPEQDFQPGEDPERRQPIPRPRISPQGGRKQQPGGVSPHGRKPPGPKGSRYNYSNPLKEAVAHGRRAREFLGQSPGLHPGRHGYPRHRLGAGHGPGGRAGRAPRRL